jgi:CheY-like chemotaxis protein
MARLVVISRSLAGTAFDLGVNWTTIGRADGNAFQVLEQSVSGRHCEVRPLGENLLVRDLLSTNGTFVEGQKITEGVVKPGQTLRLGDVELRFECSAPGPLSGAPFNSKMLVTHSAALAAKPAVAADAKPAAPDDGRKKFNVLFVDDSMAFLENFGGLCAEYANGRWEVLTAVTADRALALLQEKPVDLVVLDIAMPMLDGLQLLGIVHRRYPGIKAAVMTGLASEARRTDALNKGAELFLEKPVTAEGMKLAFNVLNDLVSWHHEGFTGALRHVGLPEVIQMECNGRHSSILEIRNPELQGEIHIDTGVIIHAAVGTLTGEPAFYRLLSLKGGEFQVKPFKSPPQRTITSRWEFLLMEVARARDEETVLVKKPAAANQPAETIGAPAPAPAEPSAPGDDFVVVATYDGKWIPSDGPQK